MISYIAPPLFSAQQRPPIEAAPDLSHPQLRGCVSWWIGLERSGLQLHQMMRHKEALAAGDQVINVGTWENGRFTGNGDNDQYSVSNAFMLNYHNGLTVTATVRLISGYVAFDRIVETAFGGGFMLGINSPATAWVFIVGGAPFNCFGGTTATGVWKNLAGVFDPSLAANQEKLYEDGLLVGTNSGKASPGFDIRACYLMKYYGGTGNNCPCSIDNVRIYNRALSANEIRDIHARPYAPFERNQLLSMPDATAIPIIVHHLREQGIS